MFQDKERDAAFLQQALKLTTEFESVQQAFNEQQEVVKQASKNLAAAQKDVQNETETEIKRKKNEISDEFNARLDERTSQIKKVKAQRGKSRAEGVKNRIQMETQSLEDANKAINQNTKEIFRQDKVPAFANSPSFYTLFVTSGIKEALIAILTVLLLLVVLPLLIYIILGKPGMLWIVLIYIVDVAVFGGLYMLITNTVKIKHAPAIDQGRKNWDRILKNRAEIRRITKRIKKDQDDSLYQLQEYDAQLIQLEQEKRSINEERLAAMAQFDSEGRARISSEIQEKNNSRLADLQDELEAANRRIEELISQTRELQLTLQKDYEPMIGKEFMSSDKLDRLLSVFRGDAEMSLAEAQEVVRSGKLPERQAHAAIAGGDDEHIPDPSEIIGGAQKGPKVQNAQKVQYAQKEQRAQIAQKAQNWAAQTGMDQAEPGRQEVYEGTGDISKAAAMSKAADASKVAAIPKVTAVSKTTAASKAAGKDAAGYDSEAEYAPDGDVDGENPFGETVSDTVDASK